MVERVKPKKKRRPYGSFQPEFNEQVERLCKLGVTDTEVALFFGVTWRTVQNWKNAHPEFFEALHRGKLEADTEIAATLFKMAKGFTYQQEQIHKRKFSKTVNGVTKTWEKIERVYVEQHSLPNPTSIIFYLKNRRADLFRDAHLIKHHLPASADPEDKQNFKDPDEFMAEVQKRGLPLIEGEYTVVSSASSPQG